MHANHDQYGVALASLGLAVILAGCGGGGGASAPATSGNVSSAPVQTSGGNESQPNPQPSETTDSGLKAPTDSPQPESSSTLPEEEPVIHAEVKLSNDSLLITVPQDTAIDVATDSPIVLAYKEKLDPGAIISVLLSDPSGVVPSSFYMTQSSVVVVADTGLKPDTLHQVRIVTTTADGGTEKTAAQITFTTGKI